MMAFVLLNEKVILTQWIGIILIILAIIIMNINFKRKI
jgi:drug/metabolite transporter (DMT)-like permease